MSESDTIFNERDRSCAAVQPMLSTDPAPSKCKCGLPRITETYQGDENKVSGYGYGLGVVSSQGYIMPPHILEVASKVNTKVYLDVLKSVVIPLVQSGSLWQTLGVAAGLGAAHKSKETQASLQ